MSLRPHATVSSVDGKTLVCRRLSQIHPCQPDLLAYWLGRAVTVADRLPQGGAVGAAGWPTSWILLEEKRWPTLRLINLDNVRFLKQDSRANATVLSSLQTSIHKHTYLKEVPSREQGGRLEMPPGSHYSIMDWIFNTYKNYMMYCSLSAIDILVKNPLSHAYAMPKSNQ